MIKRLLRIALLCLILCISFTACKKEANDKVIIYSNADDEAVELMKKTLDENGFKDKYTFQTFGTSELGGKLLVEGNTIEADVVTMSTFYLETAQKRNHMFEPLTFQVPTIEKYPDYLAPITVQEGAMMVNEKMMKELKLPQPKSLKDLSKPIYKDHVAIVDISSSSTAWLMVQALIEKYGEEESKEILGKIYENAGDHIESSGSGPLKKVNAEEAAVGFGLRQQIAKEKKEGLPVDLIDPTEGNFRLTESVAVIDKHQKNKLAMDIAQCIIEKGRANLIKQYPIALYKGEKTNSANASAFPMAFHEKLTAELLKKHQELSEESKQYIQ